MRSLLRAAVATAVASAAVLTAAPAALATGPTAAQETRAWERTGRPDRLMVIRPGIIDLLSQGSMVRRLYPPVGAVPLSWLAANSGQGWINYDSGSTSTVRVRTAVLLTPGTTLRIGARTKKVLLTAGKTEAAGTWISGSRATLEISGTTLASVAANGTSPAPADAAGRPYLSMGAGGRMAIGSTTISGFGRGGPSVPARQSGVTWGKGSTGSATGSTFQGNRVGLRLANSTGVALKQVTVKDSVEDGVVLNADHGTTVDGLTSQANGRVGLSVGGTDSRTLTGVVTRDNHGTGIKATAQRGLTLTAPESHADAGGGIRLLSCADCTVDKALVDGAAVAVTVSGTGARTTLRDPRLTGGGAGAGISLAAGIAGATVSGGTVSGFDRGIGIAASHVNVDRTAVSGNRTGIAVYGQADQVSLHSTRVSGGRVGVTASGTTSGVALSGVKISGAARKGLSSASPGLRVTGGSVSGATTAVDLGADARLETLTVSGARRGIHLATGVHATGAGLDVLAERKGIEADHGARMDITDSRVRAPIALAGDGSVRAHGRTEVTLPPFPWLGAAALAALTLAILLQTFHQVRHRKAPRPRVADHVRNTA